MKPRRVIVTIELETAAELSALRNKDMWLYIIDVSACLEAVVRQIQANVVKPEKGGA